MNEKHSEQIIDSFLQEMLTGQSPPDLSAQIVEAWEREQHLVRATPVAAPHSVTVHQVAAAQGPLWSSTRSPSKPARRRSRSAASFERNAIAAALAAVAGGLLVVLGSYWLTSASEDSLPVANQSDALPAALAANQAEDKTSQPVLASQVAPADSNSELTRALPSTSGDSNPGAAPTREVLKIDDLPFALDASSSGTRAEASAGPLPELATQSQAPRLSDAEIIRGIDQRLSQLWRDLNLVPAGQLPPQQRVVRVAQLLTNQAKAEQTLAALEASGGRSELSELVAQLTQTNEFAETWGKHFTRVWFGQSSLSGDDRRVQAAQRHVSKFISSQQPFNQIAIELLGGPVGEGGSVATDGAAASLSETLVSALAGNGNHRLVTRIGNDLLDTNLTCVRCHDSNLVAPGSAGISPVATQEVYWSLVALLQGIEVNIGEDKVRRGVDRQVQLLASGKPLVAYYDLLDGRLQAAQPLLPDGTRWNQPRSAQSELAAQPRDALAQWLSQSNGLDRSTVNHVWRALFGSPLVSSIAWSGDDPVEQLSLRARRELQLFLADQYRQHNHDLSRLISWIVQSDAIARRPLELSQAQWLAADEAQLRQLQLGQLNFAVGRPPAIAPGSNSLEDSLVTVLKWKSELQPSAANASDVTLAQPLPSVNPTEGSRRAAAAGLQRSQLKSVSYALFGEQPSPADEYLVKRLLASPRLSWEQCVEHVALLNPLNVLNGRIKHLADELLQQHSGNARAALLDLLWAVRNSDRNST